MFWFGLLHHFGFCMVQAIEIYSHDYITRVKGALDKFNIIPQLFQQKDGIFVPYHFLLFRVDFNKYTKQ